MNNDIELKLKIANEEGQAIIYRDTKPAGLTVTLTNQSEKDIDLACGSTASELDLYFPGTILPEEVKAMTIELKEWNFRFDSEYDSLTLTYSGQPAGKWKAGTDLSFVIRNVATHAQPTSNFFQVNFINFPSDVPGQLTTPMIISTPPQPGNADLKNVLQVTLDNQGMVFVSPTNDPLKNSVFLNIKNTGSTPLYNGKQAAGNPRIRALFVYGSGTGCLAPDDRMQEGYSAWDILCKLPYVQPANQWQVKNPNDFSGEPHPVWEMRPAGTNSGIIGTGENANVTFNFSEIVSATPPGHTQLVLQFTGFMKDEKTAYDDAVFVLDIVKMNPPATRGVIHFFSERTLIDIYAPNETISIPLRWCIFNVAKVSIMTVLPGMEPKEFYNPEHLPVTYGEWTIPLDGVSQNTSLTLTIQAYDGAGSFLNSMQFTVYIRANFFLDPRDSKVYRGVRIGNQLWMAHNLNYDAPSGTKIFGKKEEYGLLYQWNIAAPPAETGGWRLPNQSDWEQLISNYENDKMAYEALIDGGSSGFDALLNGMYKDTGEGFDTYGYYWTASESRDEATYVGFSANSRSVLKNLSFNKKYYLSVRYVKELK